MPHRKAFKEKQYDYLAEEDVLGQVTDVVVVLMTDAILFSGLNKQQDVLVYRFAQIQDDAIYEENNFVYHEIMNEPLIALPGQSNVHIFLADKRQMPIPSSVKPNENWLSKVHYVLPNEKVSSDSSCNKDIRIQYPLSQDTLEVIERYIPDANIYPITKIIYQQSIVSKANILITHKKFWWTIYDNGQLQAWHVGNYQNIYDVIYSLQYTCQTKEISQIQEIGWCGVTDNIDEIQEILSNHYTLVNPFLHKLNGIAKNPTVSLIKSLIQCV